MSPKERPIESPSHIDALFEDIDKMLNAPISGLKEMDAVQAAKLHLVLSKGLHAHFLLGSQSPIKDRDLSDIKAAELTLRNHSLAAEGLDVSALVGTDVDALLEVLGKKATWLLRSAMVRLDGSNDPCNAIRNAIQSTLTGREETAAAHRGAAMVI